MAGVFVSYARADQRLARRIHNALASLELDVLWDENMPSVRWREYIESNIRSLDAVLVLWTGESSRSEAVLDEALEAYAQKKLINSMHAIKEPPAPFNKVNAAKLDGWEAGKPHSGWEKVVATLDGLLAPNDEGKRPGGLIARYKLQLSEVRERRAALDVAEREGTQRQRRQKKAAEECAAANEKLLTAKREAGDVKAMVASSKVVAAAMAAAQAEIDEAQIALNAAKDRLSEIDAEVEKDNFDLEEKRKNLAGYLVLIGGDGDGDEGQMASKPQPFFSTPPDVPETRTDHPQPEKAVEPRPVAPKPPIDERKSVPVPPPVPWWKKPWAIASGIVVAIALLVWASGIIDPPAVQEAGTDAVAAAEDATADAAAAMEEAPVDVARAKIGWLLSNEWVIDGSCNRSLPIALNGDGSKLVFGNSGDAEAVSYSVGDNDASVKTSTTVYQKNSDGTVTMKPVSGSGNTPKLTKRSEASACAM